MPLFTLSFGRSSQTSRFFQVWLPLGLPRLADHPVYFGSASFISLFRVPPYTLQLHHIPNKGSRWAATATDCTNTHSLVALLSLRLPGLFKTERLAYMVGSSVRVTRRVGWRPTYSHHSLHKLHHANSAKTYDTNLSLRSRKNESAN